MTDPEPTIREALALEGPACFTCSFQAEDVVVLDVLRKQSPKIPVLFLETGYHFPETLEYRDRLASDWKLNLINLRPQTNDKHPVDPEACCGVRKVVPLFSALENYDVWFTGLRREQSPTRAGLQPFGTHHLVSGKTLHKIAPLFDWTWKDVWAYLTVHEIPHLSLYDKGYTSIGCEPCTALPDGDNLRSGRWGGKKLECGIHIEPVQIERSGL